MEPEPDPDTPLTASITVRAVYDQGRDEYPLLEIEEIEGIENRAHLVELLWYAIKSADEAGEDATEDPQE